MKFTKRQLHNFWSKVAIKDRCSCWEWQASRKGTRKGPGGYGQFKLNGRPHLAHRVAFAMVHGHEPEDKLMHCCDNPACVNPGHLKEGTHQDNMDDMKQKGRQGKRLTLAQVQEIRSSNEKTRILARRHGVSNRTIRSVRKRITWNA